jgi:hypothetical protein
VARCGHCARLPEAALPDYGVKPNAPIASFGKRLTCLNAVNRKFVYRSGKSARNRWNDPDNLGECYGPGAESESDPVGRR